jgi:hypothetical protein
MRLTSRGRKGRDWVYPAQGCVGEYPRLRPAGMRLLIPKIRGKIEIFGVHQPVKAKISCNYGFGFIYLIGTIFESLSQSTYDYKRHQSKRLVGGYTIHPLLNEDYYV